MKGCSQNGGRGDWANPQRIADLSTWRYSILDLTHVNTFEKPLDSPDCQSELTVVRVAQAVQRRKK